MARYSPRECDALRWHKAVPRFAAGADTPRAWLERCLETIAARELVVRPGPPSTTQAPGGSGCQHRPLARGAAALADRWHADRHQGSARAPGHAGRDGLRRLSRPFPGAGQCRV